MHQERFNPRRWGFFISGHRDSRGRSAHQVSIPVDGAFLFQDVFLAVAFLMVVTSFNPRRWGFFISGFSAKVVEAANSEFQSP